MSKPNAARALSPELSAHVAAVVHEYRGSCPSLSEAIGALVFGQFYGWKGVYMIYSRAKVRSMEEILGLKFREVMPERTDDSARINGIRIADELGKFWAVAKAEISVPGGKQYADDLGQSDLFLGA